MFRAKWLCSRQKLFPFDITRVIALACLSVFCTTPSTAQVFTQEIPVNFNEVKVSYAPNEAAGKLVLWAAVKGDSSAPVYIRVDGPIGSSVTLEGAQLKGTPQATLASTSGWYLLELDRTVRPLGARSASITAARGALTAATNSAIPVRAALDLCSAISPQDLATIGTTLFGPSWTRTQVCDWIKSQVAGLPGYGEEGISVPGYTGGEELPGEVSGNPYNPSDPLLTSGSYGSIDMRALFHKDSCSPGINTYILRATIDLSSINRATFPSGLTIRSRVFTETYSGRTSSSIKPASEGKFNGKPLILMSTLGWNESISVVQWSRGIPLRSTAVPVDGSDRVYWQGLVLARAPIDRLLSGRARATKRRGQGGNNSSKPGAVQVGQRATFELYSPEKSYGVCLRVNRSRQRVNGYPG